MSSPVIGIKFGNTSSFIAYVNPKKDVDIIADPDGERSIPSCLSYVGKDEYHGGQALQQLICNPNNTIVNFRDFIGLPYDECDVSRCSIGAPVVEIDGKAGFVISRDGGKLEKLTVDEVISRHLNRLKQAAEDYIGLNVEQTVLTVPTSFTENQREALKAAAAKVGLKVIQFISEASSALFAYLEQFKIEKDINVVVADFGGVRSDVTVISVRNGLYTVLAAEHDSNLGGNQLDCELIEFFAKDFECKYNCNPRKRAKSMCKLKINSQIAKKTLSNATNATMSIETLADGYDYHVSINRMRYNLISNKIFTKFLQLIESVIEKAKMNVLEIDAVLLVGGVSFTPILATNLESTFPKSVEILGQQHKNATKNPDELSVAGAALQAQLLSLHDEDELEQALQPIVLNMQHTSKNIGVLDAEGKFVPVLLAGTPYPIRKSITLENATGDLLISVYEGSTRIKETVLEPQPKDEAEAEDYESDWSDENDELEVIKEKEYALETKLMDLGIKKVDGLELSFNIAKDGELTVAARDLKSGHVVKGTL